MFRLIERFIEPDLYILSVRKQATVNLLLLLLNNNLLDSFKLEAFADDKKKKKKMEFAFGTM